MREEKLKKKFLEFMVEVGVTGGRTEVLVDYTAIFF